MSTLVVLGGGIEGLAIALEAVDAGWDPDQGHQVIVLRRTDTPTTARRAIGRLARAPVAAALQPLPGRPWVEPIALFVHPIYGDQSDREESP